MSPATLRHRWYEGALVLMLILVVARLILEVAGADHAWTRYISATAGLFLVAIYLGAVAPRREVTRFAQLVVPAIILAAWTAGWVIVATFISGAFHLQRSHFAAPEDYGNWSNLGRHILEHVESIPILAALALILMAVPYLLHHWPVTVAPAAVLGGLVIVRYWVEAMEVSPMRAAAWSSTVAMILCALYLGGTGPQMGLTSARQLFWPALVIGWVWRFWVFLAAVLSAVVPFYHTHFFDPSEGRIVARLATFLAGSAVEGFIAGLLVWAIASWTVWVTRREATA
ncbi:MAG TPA: hypothetical protein VJV74_09235 [Terriglobia bacterium]|nr:hypothetical protein [Terriglobia bacterium]